MTGLFVGPQGRDGFRVEPLQDVAGEALLAELAGAGGLPSPVVLVEGAVEVGTAYLVQSPVVWDARDEGRRPQGPQGHG